MTFFAAAHQIDHPGHRNVGHQMISQTSRKQLRWIPSNKIRMEAWNIAFLFVIVQTRVSIIVILISLRSLQNSWQCVHDISNFLDDFFLYFDFSFTSIYSRGPNWQQSITDLNAPSHYLDRWWSSLPTHIRVTQSQWVSYQKAYHIRLPVCI